MTLVRILILALAVAGILLMWDFLASMLSPPSARAGIAEALMEEVAADLVTRAGSERLVLLELEGDHDSEVTGLLYDALIKRDSAAVAGDYVKASDFPSPPPVPAEQLEYLAERQNARYALVGRIEKYAQEGPNVEVAIDVSLVDTRVGEASFERSYEESREAGILEGARYAVGTLPWFARLLGWIVVTALLPVLLLPLLRMGIEEESNLINAFLLGGLTLVSGLLAWFAVGYGAALLFEIITLVCSVFLSGIYYYWILDRLAG